MGQAHVCDVFTLTPACRVVHASGSPHALQLPFHPPKPPAKPSTTAKPPTTAAAAPPSSTPSSPLTGGGTQPTAVAKAPPLSQLFVNDRLFATLAPEHVTKGLLSGVASASGTPHGPVSLNLVDGALLAGVASFLASIRFINDSHNPMDFLRYLSVLLECDVATPSTAINAATTAEGSPSPPPAQAAAAWVTSYVAEVYATIIAFNLVDDPTVIDFGVAGAPLVFQLPVRLPAALEPYAVPQSFLFGTFCDVHDVDTSDFVGGELTVSIAGGQHQVDIIAFQPDSHAVTTAETVSSGRLGGEEEGAASSSRNTEAVPWAESQVAEGEGTTAFKQPEEGEHLPAAANDAPALPGATTMAAASEPIVMKKLKLFDNDQVVDGETLVATIPPQTDTSVIRFLLKQCSIDALAAIIRHLTYEFKEVSSMTSPRTTGATLKRVLIVSAKIGSDPRAAKVEVTTPLFVAPPLLILPAALAKVKYEENAGAVRLCNMEVSTEDNGWDGGMLQLTMTVGWTPDDKLGIKADEELTLAPAGPGAMPVRSRLIPVPRAKSSRFAQTVQTMVSERKIELARRRQKLREQLDAELIHDLNLSDAQKFVVSVNGSRVGIVWIKDDRLLLLLDEFIRIDATKRFDACRLKRKDISAVLRRLTFSNDSDNPRELRKIVTITLSNGLPHTATAAVEIQVISRDDLTQLVRASADAPVFRSKSEADVKGWCPFADVAVVDPDTFSFNGGVLRVDLVGGGDAASDQLGLLSEAEQKFGDANAPLVAARGKGIWIGDVQVAEWTLDAPNVDASSKIAVRFLPVPLPGAPPPPAASEAAGGAPRRRSSVTLAPPSKPSSTRSLPPSRRKSDATDPAGSSSLQRRRSVVLDDGSPRAPAVVEGEPSLDIPRTSSSVVLDGSTSGTPQSPTTTGANAVAASLEEALEQPERFISHRTIEQVLHCVTFTTTGAKVRAGPRVYQVQVGCSANAMGKLKLSLNVLPPTFWLPDFGTDIAYKENSPAVKIYNKLAVNVSETELIKAGKITVELHGGGNGRLGDPHDTLGFDVAKSEFNVMPDAIPVAARPAGSTAEYFKVLCGRDVLCKMEKARRAVVFRFDYTCKAKGKHLAGLLRCVTFLNTSDNPTLEDRTVSLRWVSPTSSTASSQQPAIRSGSRGPPDEGGAQPDVGQAATGDPVVEQQGGESSAGETTLGEATIKLTVIPQEDPTCIVLPAGDPPTVVRDAGAVRIMADASVEDPDTSEFGPETTLDVDITGGLASDYLTFACAADGFNIRDSDVADHSRPLPPPPPPAPAGDDRDKAFPGGTVPPLARIVRSSTCKLTLQVVACTLQQLSLMTRSLTLSVQSNAKDRSNRKVISMTLLSPGNGRFKAAMPVTVLPPLVQSTTAAADGYLGNVTVSAACNRPQAVLSSSVVSTAHGTTFSQGARIAVAIRRRLPEGDDQSRAWQLQLSAPTDDVAVVSDGTLLVGSKHVGNRVATTSGGVGDDGSGSLVIEFLPGCTPGIIQSILHCVAVCVPDAIAEEVLAGSSDGGAAKKAPTIDCRLMVSTGGFHQSAAFGIVVTSKPISATEPVRPKKKK